MQQQKGHHKVIIAAWRRDCVLVTVRDFRPLQEDCRAHYYETTRLYSTSCQYQTHQFSLRWIFHATLRFVHVLPLLIDPKNPMWSDLPNYSACHHHMPPVRPFVSEMDPRQAFSRFCQLFNAKHCSTFRSTGCSSLLDGKRKKNWTPAKRAFRRAGRLRPAPNW
jgi:hypothetical protein